MSDNLLTEFLAECREHLQDIESDLLAIEQAGDNADTELINKVFRAAHSIKGGSAFFNLEKIKTLAHRIETALDMIRSRKLKINAETINVLLNAFDALSALINDPEETVPHDISSFDQALQNLVEQSLGDKKKSVLSRDAKLSSDEYRQNVTIPEIDLQAARKDSQYIYLIEYDLLHDIERQNKSFLELISSLSKMGVIIDTSLDMQSIGTLEDKPGKNLPVKVVYRTVLEPSFIDQAVEVPKRNVHTLLRPKDIKSKIENKGPLKTGRKNKAVKKEEPIQKQVEEVKTVATVEADNQVQKQKNSDEGSGNSKAVPETVRINVEALDTLMSQAGELVLSRNQLIDAISRSDKRAISASAQRLSFVISELQEAVMQTRLQPIGNIFNKFPRMIRDLSKSLNKELRLVIEGKDVELDKTIIEGLSDPLTHMVRNAADHGIEPSQQRIQSGKPPEGTINLRAFHEAGHVVVEIEDDGGGINTDKIVSKALSMGLINEEKLKGLTEYDKNALIFLPGLSTADKVTETSGRGVGMDVVKNNLDKLGGKVTIRSIKGKGTVFTIKLPLTLAIIPSLIVVEEKERFAIPQVNVVELLRIRASQVKERIQVVGDAEVVVVRGELIPVVRFSDILGIIKTYTDPNTNNKEIDRRKNIADRRSPKRNIDGDFLNSDNPNACNRRATKDRRRRPSGDLNIVIISSGLLQYGLVVDELRDTEEIVVKPLGSHLKGLQEYAGATIMGDGEIALILDVNGIALKAGITSVSAINEKKKRSDESSVFSDSTHSLLLFNNQEDETCAIPLDLVQRVEKIKADQIELKGGVRTMQYRGASLQLVQLADLAKVAPVPLNGELAVVVTSVSNHNIGLLGLMPVSVVEKEFVVDTSTHRQHGISGSVIINEKTVLMVDIFELIDSLHPDWKIQSRKDHTANSATLLLVEDSEFFRGQVAKYLEDGGHSVITAVDGIDGWEKLQENKDRISIVVTDIEMPKMNGFELCSKIRSEFSNNEIPVIALTSLAGEEDRIKGLQAGITDYQVKLDRDRLLSSISNLLIKEEIVNH
jgi:two-component system chemotaxis sensor kinase CheA